MTLRCDLFVPPYTSLCGVSGHYILGKSICDSHLLSLTATGQQTGPRHHFDETDCGDDCEVSDMVMEAAHYMDRYGPLNWYIGIDLARIDESTDNRCLLAIVYGDLDRGLWELLLDHAADEAAGFLTDSAISTDVWRAQIVGRQQTELHNQTRLPLYYPEPGSALPDVMRRKRRAIHADTLHWERL